jgi:drug/metabolite transporter (DMT)-like permease
MSDENKGLLLGLFGVSLFALTLPLTKVLVAAIGIYEANFLRASLTGIIALGFIVISGARLPRFRQEWHLLMPIIIAIGLGFPIGTAYAMQTIPPGQGGVVLGLTPLLTSIIGASISNQKLSTRFWIAAFIGFIVITLYSLNKNQWVISQGEFGLLVASISAGLGYAKAGKLSQIMDSKEVISWVMAISLIFNIPLAFLFLGNDFISLSEKLFQPLPLFALLSLAMVTMYIANFFWYHGLSIGGIAKVGQLLLLQPIITLFVSGLFFSESVEIIDYTVCLMLIGIVLYCRRTPISNL